MPYWRCRGRYKGNYNSKIIGVLKMGSLLKSRLIARKPNHCNICSGWVFVWASCIIIIVYCFCFFIHTGKPLIINTNPRPTEKPWINSLALYCKLITFKRIAKAIKPTPMVMSQLIFFIVLFICIVLWWLTATNLNLFFQLNNFCIRFEETGYAIKDKSWKWCTI